MNKINLAGTWSLKSTDHKVSTQIELPGDIYTALINAEIIPHPYKDQNELETQWVHQLDWIMEKTIEISEIPSGSLQYFHGEVLDTAARIEVNGIEIGSSDNMFVPAWFDTADALKTGKNSFKIYIDSAEKTAVKRAELHPYIIPAQPAPVESPARNFLRKVQCHSGWDWGPCIMTGGVYQSIELDFTDIRLEGLNYDLEKRGDDWELTVKGTVYAGSDMEALLQISVADAVLEEAVPLNEGIYSLEKTLLVKSPELWWPNGEGEQRLYDLNINLGDRKEKLIVGFRTLEVVNDEDAIGLSMYFRVNGRDIFAKGANWIPTDALPSSQDEDKTTYLLESAAAVHMNMIRVWGGGQYETEHFYNKCDELGLLIWQDFMFACSLYPSNPEFLNSVENEVKAQIPRLKSHPCMALFCGNNEDLGALTWYEEARKNRDRYLVDYDRLNEGVIGKAVKELAPGHSWWPSSPSAGEGDYSDCWHDDSRGDMHYWSVWHEGKPFESYYDILPRFCSEFGFQSFPTYNMVSEYADEDMQNVTSPVMMHHQKNLKGNEIIISTLSRYFRFPHGFKDFIYLSQVQQSWAIQTAVEYWRSNRPTCMGALYWQLNDNWPVASWASIDYSGAWKLLHYGAARFFNPLLIAGWMKDGNITAAAVNDRAEDIKAKARLIFRNFSGEILRTVEKELDLKAGSAQQFYTEELEDEKSRQNSYLELVLETEKETLKNTLFLHVPRMCSLEEADVQMKVNSIENGESKYTIELKTDKPAFFIHLRGQKGDVFSDNGFHMGPGEIKVIDFSPADEKVIDPELTHLRKSY
ncbi:MULTISPECIES: glycoside hydrolase family 2 protein [unclassified Oceanispirochaeta]|uniref:beta-mannosidase n=1 Tax=unclassified Oceanispirochaeta TaxID=2635722 RepID=UPI000E09054A|nr:MULTISPECIES: glycoside hydrolase family 2 protein [unclassified Oceanispirochaeta]MBF9016478.1 glycoside hydrolase family 2 protein [Oceanispirochaeta sp. M2]NPD72940.1 glycoside hydrolase family 2 protein [Oceanispirochaeta sp. M1]RDG31514.1 glycoside hydrolase family 2 protein [Oceanispirochaeta sp. M1]